MTKFINWSRSPGNPKSGKATICPIRKGGELRGRRHRGTYFRTITDDVGHRPWLCHYQNLIDRRFGLRDTMVAAYPIKLVPRWIYRKNLSIVAMFAQVAVNLRIVLTRCVYGANKRHGTGTEQGCGKAWLLHFDPDCKLLTTGNLYRAEVRRGGIAEFANLRQGWHHRTCESIRRGR